MVVVVVVFFIIVYDFVIVFNVIDNIGDLKRIVIIVIVRLMMEIYLVSWFCWVDFFWLFLKKFFDDSKERIIVVYLKGKLNKRVIRVRVR